MTDASKPNEEKPQQEPVTPAPAQAPAEGSDDIPPPNEDSPGT